MSMFFCALSAATNRASVESVGMFSTLIYFIIIILVFIGIPLTIVYFLVRLLKNKNNKDYSKKE